MKKYLVSFIASLSVFGLLQFVAPQANAQFDTAREQACAGLSTVDANGAANNCSATAGGSRVNSVLATGLNWLSIVAGVIAVVMMIIAGIKFLTSQGDPGAVNSARNTIIYAAVGIVIVALSQVIVNFVLNTAINDPPPPAPVSTSPDNTDNESGCTPIQIANDACEDL